MKRAICFFSGTGNTFYVAQKIHCRFPESSLFFIPHTDPLVLATYDEIGIITPVYIFGLPEIVRKFVAGMTFEGNPRIYAIFVCGGYPGISSDLTQQALKKTNKVLTYQEYIRMPDNYILMYKVDEDLNRQLLHEMEVKLESILSVLENQGTFTYRPHFWGFLKWFQKLAAKTPSKTSKKYIVTGCIGCLKCVQLCPVDNIVYDKKTIVFDDKCTGCLGCINICPVQAINYGKVTQKQGRYFNPNIDYQAIKKSSL
ncbi:MAG: EFR1 family ferrodoxin [Candidatus Izemoplasmatales bacterium]|jgi:ferredoxin|nr:EFR1 family ferrodoxin [Candidatus Izemoplasmatales bacterium]